MAVKNLKIPILSLSFLRFDLDQNQVQSFFLVWNLGLATLLVYLPSTESIYHDRFSKYPY
jgi:hypothetical protein